MSTENTFKDPRLLEALEYLDKRFIAEVFDDLKVPSRADEYVPGKRTPFKHWKQFVALAACLILLSFASPIVNYVVEAVRSFSAGWGSGTTEEDSGIVIDTLDTTEEMETLTDMPETSESTDGMYDEYVLTDEDLAGLNSLYIEATGNEFASTPQAAMRRDLFNGTFYYGKYGDCIVFSNASELCAVRVYNIGDYVFTFPQYNYLFVYCNSSIYSLEQAYKNGYLSDYELKKLNEFHILVLGGYYN